MSTKPALGTEWSAKELHSKLVNGEDFFVFDVRAEDEFKAWRIEGEEALSIVNVPYYEMLMSDEFDEVTDSFQAFLESGTAETLPRHQPILAVCARGDTSGYVAEAMRNLGFDAFNLSGGAAAWGDHYDLRPVVEGDSAIYQISRPARGCLSYVVASQGRAVVIDPLRHTRHYVSLAEEKGLDIVQILDTHGHADHISGGPELAEELGVPYHLHPYDGVHPIDVLPASIDYDFLKDGQAFVVGGKTLEALHIPGHTLGNMAFLWDGKYLLSGDSIFVESIARPDLGGQANTWASLHYASLKRLLALPEATTVLPAHFSGLREANDAGVFAASLGHLGRSNDGLAMVVKPEEEFVAYVLESLPRFPEEYVDIKRVNAGLLEIGEAQATELELGKNICALAQAYEESTVS